MTTWFASLELLVPPYERVPRKVAEGLGGAQTESLDNSASLEQYTAWIWECIHARPRQMFPQLDVFRSIILRPLKEDISREDTRIYTSELRVSGQKDAKHHTPYVLRIRLTFRKSCLEVRAPQSPG